MYLRGGEKDEKILFYAMLYVDISCNVFVCRLFHRWQNRNSYK